MLFNWELHRGRGDQGLYLYNGTACLLHAAHYRELGQYHDRVYHRGPNRGPGLRRRTMTISTTRFHIRLRRPSWQVALASGLGRAVAPSSHHTCRVACRLISTRSLTMASADHIHLEKKSPCCPVVRSLDRRLLSTIGRACCGVTRGTLICTLKVRRVSRWLAVTPAERRKRKHCICSPTSRGCSFFFLPLD